MKHKLASLITQLRAYRVHGITLLVAFTLICGMFFAPIGPLGRKSRGGRWTYSAPQVQQLAKVDLPAFERL